MEAVDAFNMGGVIEEASTASSLSPALKEVQRNKIKTIENIAISLNPFLPLLIISFLLCFVIHPVKGKKSAEVHKYHMLLIINKLINY